MPDKQNYPHSLWQELNRRKVLRVITVYAAVAFVILQLVEILAPSLRLPEWTMNFVLVVLIVGFIIALILSWIYDIHPEGGIVKTEPAHKVKSAAIPKSSNSWKIASYISFVVIVGLIFLNVFPRSGNRKALEKSIAVLPLEYLSEDPDKEYLASGVLDAITGNLSLIKGLRVMPRTSVEQYRENKKSAKEIGEELDVSYLIVGSFLMIEDQVKLTIQLVVAKEGDHVFFQEYDRNYKDIIVVQSEVAQTIAKEIEVAITPEEKQRIEKMPTEDLTAYGLYQRGREEYIIYWKTNDRNSLDRAKELYHEALKSDPEFALAYTGLARVYWYKHYWESFFSEEFLDSVLILANKALSYNDQLSAAYKIKGDYYRETGLTEKAIQEYDKATRFNPNDWGAYLGKAWLYYNDDLVKSIENFHKAAFINRGKDLPMLLRRISMAYRSAGFLEKAKYYNHEALKFARDSSGYLAELISIEQVAGNYREAIALGERYYALNASSTSILISLGKLHMFLGQYEESLAYIFRYVERLEEIGSVDINDMAEVGYIYWQNGYREEAEYYLQKQINYCKSMIELGRAYADLFFLTYYDLAAVYAFKGEKDKAYENLRIYNQRQVENSWMVRSIKDDPLFDSIRDEPEFQQIVRDVESKFQAEHERVRKWLEENDML
jgi:TolB-like protein/Tfp pilus assembly protein PilF